MTVFKAGVAYFAIVFAAGFVLGAVRVPLLVPRLGARAAELIEMPIMLMVIQLAARYVVRRYSVRWRPANRAAVGVLALVLLLTAEFTVVLGLRGLSVSDYVASRDPVAGTVYLLMLGVFAAMPLLAGRGASERT